MVLVAYVSCRCEAACPHPDGDYVHLRVTNWPRYRRFQDALEAGGVRHYPALLAHLPEGNFGSTPAFAAPAMLAELEYFTEQARLGERLVVVDERTGDEMFEYTPAYGGVWAMGDGYEIGVDPDGFFVTEPGPGRTLFRSHRFRQRVLDAGVELTDRERTVVLPIDPVAARSGAPPPEFLRTEYRPRLAAAFAPIVDALRTLCQASIDTGNPIEWA